MPIIRDYCYERLGMNIREHPLTITGEGGKKGNNSYLYRR